MPGVGFNLKRFEMAATSAFATKAQKLPERANFYTEKVVDTVFMAENPDFIQSVHGTEVNCVLPLMGKDELDIAEIYETRLWKLLMTFNVMANIDRVDDDAHLALLATVYIPLMHQTDDAAVELKKRLLESVHVLYVAGGSFKTLVDKLIEDSSEVFGDKKNEKILSKIIFAAEYMTYYKKIDKDELEEILDKTWVEYFAKRLQERESSLERMISFNFEKNIVDTFLEGISGRKIIEKYWTSREIIRDVDSKFVAKNFKVTFDPNSKAGLNPTGLKEDTERKINWGVMNCWNKLITGAKPEDNKVIAYICAAISYNGNVESRANAAISYDEEYNNKIIGNELFAGKKADTKKLVHRIKVRILSGCKENYFKQFQSSHFNTKPLKWEEIEKLATERGIDSKQLRYCSDSMLIMNACQSPDCPHFLKPVSKSLRDHLGGWQEKMPRGFHLFVNNHLSQSEDEILEQYKKERNIADFAKYKKSDEEVLDYIRLVKEAYVAA